MWFEINCFSEKVTIIEDELCSGCYYLQSITFLGNVTSIGYNSFYQCPNLKSIQIPNSVTFINRAFCECSILENVYFFGLSSPENESDIFEETSVKEVYVNKDYKDNHFCGYPVRFTSIFPSSVISSNIITETIKVTTDEGIVNTGNYPTSFFYSSSLSSSSFSSISTQIFVSHELSYSLTSSLTFINLRSVSFSMSYFLLRTYTFSYNINYETFYIFETQTFSYKYFPYIIHYLSPTYVASYIGIKPEKKRKISPEQLIGIVCGSVSVVFLILAIIILVIRKMYENKFVYDDFSFSSDYDEEECEKEQEIMQNNANNISDNDKSDIDFWL